MKSLFRVISAVLIIGFLFSVCSASLVETPSVKTPLGSNVIPKTSSVVFKDRINGQISTPIVKTPAPVVQQTQYPTVQQTAAPAVQLTQYPTVQQIESSTVGSNGTNVTVTIGRGGNTSIPIAAGSTTSATSTPKYVDVTFMMNTLYSFGTKIPVGTTGQLVGEKIIVTKKNVAKNGLSWSGVSQFTNKIGTYPFVVNAGYIGSDGKTYSTSQGPFPFRITKVHCYGNWWPDKTYDYSDDSSYVTSWRLNIDNTPISDSTNNKIYIEITVEAVRSVDVYARPVKYTSWLPIVPYHAFIITTSEDGKKLYFRGGPIKNDFKLKYFYPGGVNGFQAYMGDYNKKAYDWCTNPTVINKAFNINANKLLDYETSFDNTCKSANSRPILNYNVFNIGAPNCNSFAKYMLQQAGLDTTKPEIYLPGWNIETTDAPFTW